MREALAGGLEGPGTLADRLRTLAERLLDEAQDGPPIRATAMTLLAADALATYACEWLAEFAPEQLGEAQ